MTLIFKASPGQLVFAGIRSGLAIAFGVALFTSVPAPTNYVMLLFCCLVAVAAPIEESYNRLEISDLAVSYITLFHRWSVPLGEIKDWKIMGGTDTFTSLRIFTHDGREYAVHGLARLGVRDSNRVAKALAKCLRKHRKGKQ